MKPITENKKTLFFISLALYSAAVGAGCVPPISGPPIGAGPIDGNYKVSTHTCNGLPMKMQLPGGQSVDPAQVPTLWGINDNAGSISQLLNDSCVVSDPAVFTYPSANSLTLSVPGPSACGGSCSGSECTAGQTSSGATGPYLATYSVTGSTLTLTFNSTKCNDTQGDVEVFTLTQQ